MSTRAARLLLPVIYLGFISLGLPDGTLGVAWPQLHGTLHLPLGLAGPMLLGVTLLSAGSSWASGAVLQRLSMGPVVTVSCLLTGGALLLVGHASGLAGLALAAVPLGLGAGTVDAGLNGYVARHYSGRHMSWLHACWGGGATVGPLLMAAAVTRPDGWRAGYTTIATVQLTLVVVFAATLGWWRAVPERPAAPAGAGGADGGSSGGLAVADSAAGWLSAGIFAVYVAIETMTGLWLSTVLVETRGATVAVAGLCATGYYGAITGGRLLSGVVVDRWGNRRMVRAGAGLALLGAVGFALPLPVGVGAAALVVLGLGFAPIYPGLMHEVPRRFVAADVQRVIGRQSAGAYVGGALLPAIAGGLVQLVAVESVVLLAVVGAVALVVGIRRLDQWT